MQGTIIRWFDEKNYGFIRGEDGKEYFFHRSDVEESHRIKKNAEVEFEKLESSKGSRAQEIIIVS